MEDFNNLDNQTTHPWTIEQDDLYDINFEIINLLGTNDAKNIVDNKDEKIYLPFQFNIDSNYLGKKRKMKKIKAKNRKNLKALVVKYIIKNKLFE